MQVPPLGPAPILGTDPVLLCAVAEQNGEVAVHVYLSLFISMEVSSTAKQAWDKYTIKIPTYQTFEAYPVNRP